MSSLRRDLVGFSAPRPARQRRTHLGSEGLLQVGVSLLQVATLALRLGQLRAARRQLVLELRVL